MPTKSIATGNGFWSWLSAVDQAIHEDPAEVQGRKVREIETRLAAMEAQIRGSRTE